MLYISDYRGFGAPHTLVEEECGSVISVRTSDGEAYTGVFIREDAVSVRLVCKKRSRRGAESVSLNKRNITAVTRGFF